jgi:hypothetical protein
MSIDAEVERKYVKESRSRFLLHLAASNARVFFRRRYTRW